MIKILNILHYSIYLIHYKLHLLANKINPFRLLHKLPMQKKKYEELGIDIDQEVDSAFSDRNHGLSVLVSGGVLISILFLLIFVLFQLITKLLSIKVVLTTYIFIAFAVLSFMICYIFVFQKSKYLSYFEKFDNWTKQKKNMYVMLSIIFMVLIVFLFFINLY